MEIEHCYLWMLSKKALSDVALRVIFYLQIAHKVGPNPERRLVYISRRRTCKRLAISIGACRSAMKQLVDLGFIQMTDSRGNPIEDLSSNWILLNPKGKLNQPHILRIVQSMNSENSTSDAGSSVDPESEGLFDRIMEE